MSKSPRQSSGIGLVLGGVVLLIIGVIASLALLPPPDAEDPATAGATRQNEVAGAAPKSNGLVGEPRPTFTLPDLDGEPRTISEWDGNLVLLNFWATWCPPCRKEMPLFQDRHEALESRGFKVVAVAIDDPDPTRAFIDEFQLEFPILTGQDDAMNVSRAYGNRIGALPYTVLIGRDGRILDVHRGEVTAAHLDAWTTEHL